VTSLVALYPKTWRDRYGRCATQHKRLIPLVW
jgi:hypothetical protein